MSKVVLRLENVYKSYRRLAHGYSLRTLKSALVGGSLVRDLRREETIEALRDISFEVEAGQALALVGANGSGKSTLLKILAGLLRPTAGSVEVDGRLAALIELGAGFHPEISGRENVYINGTVLGMSRREIDERYDRIVEFAELEDFIDEPVKNYSSGMYVRLGFSIAIHTDPEILLVDEVLSVGDEEFSHRCLHRIEEFLARGRTLVLVSHSLDLVEELCDRAVWIDRGSQRLLGAPRRVVDAYRQEIAEREGEAHRRDKQARESERREAGGDEKVRDPVESSGEVSRWGSRAVEIETARLLQGGGETYNVASGSPVTFEIEVRAHEPQTDFVFGIAVHTPRGIECWGTNTDLAGFEPVRLTGAATVRIECPRMRLGPGEYWVDLAVHQREGAPFDYRKRIFAFTVTSRDRGVGVYFPEHRWSTDGGIEWKPPGAAGAAEEESQT